MSFRAYRVKAELPGKKRPNLEVIPNMRGSKLNWYRVCAQLNSIYTEYKVNVVLCILSISWIKGTQAWDKFEFFWPILNPYMPFVNVRKKFRFFSFDFRQNFDVRTFPRWLSIRGTQFFFRDIQKNFFF
jgi:hypothetical protein